MTSEAAAPHPRQKGLDARSLKVGLLAGYVAIVGGGVLFWESEAVRVLVSGPLLFGAAFIAAVASVAAWRTHARPSGTAWFLFALAGAVSTLAHFVPHSRGLHYFWLTSYALLLAGVAVTVYQDERGRRTEFLLDVALMVTAATVVVVRWAPGAHAAPDISQTNATLLLIVFGPVFAFAALLFGTVLVTGPRTALSKGTLFGIAGMIAAFAISALPQVFLTTSCCHTGTRTAMAAIGVWLFIAFAAVCAWSEETRIRPIPMGDRLRRFVAPTVAIVLSTISFEVALNPLEPLTAVALGVLGALVAVRLSELLNATRTHAADRRELAKTRALVEVTRALAGKNELDATLQTVTQWAARVLNARAAAIELLSDDGRTLILRAAEGLPDHTIGMHFPVDTSFTGRVIVTGEARVTVDSTRDPYMMPSSVEFLGNAAVAATPLRYRDRLLGVLSCIGHRPFEPADLEMLSAFADQAALALEDARLFDQVRALSITDPLTGLANRRQLDRELRREFAAAQRGRRLVVVMFDLDDFKAHNDRYGHVAGDQALHLFGQTLGGMTRAMNLAARYGGDEFCALLADAETEGTEIFTSRVRDGFYRAMEQAGEPHVHVSIGYAEYTPDMKEPEDLIEAADRALYVSKSAADVRR